MTAAFFINSCCRYVRRGKMGENMNYINPDFEKYFGQKPEYLFSAPGRTELSGNHTDHQHGCVLAAAINLEMLAWVRTNDTDIIRVMSEGYPLSIIDLNDTDMKEEEKNTTNSLIRGIAAKFMEMGCEVKGFDAYVTSTVLPGSGLSSSAAFEVLIGTVINHLYYGGKATPVEVAQIGQWAENVYFGKPCGLMDQTASAVGSVISIDFADNSNPAVEKIDLDLTASGYALCIIDSGADHADLTDEYAAITVELKNVCRFFGKEYLREVDEDEFYSNIAEVRRAAGDRAVLRAIHVFAENKRVQLQKEALKSNDFDAFLKHVKDSGLSSWRYLQNVTPAGYTAHQEVAFALALAEKLLSGTKGVCRVHGGGFAGTIQAFVPLEVLTEFKSGMEKVLGKDRCHVLSVRSEGGVLIKQGEF
ncbi:MAG: galactokinase [Oscillospiraceae bacterium]|nr:galactokinase [Oscillospiraceae bacterium]